MTFQPNNYGGGLCTLYSLAPGDANLPNSNQLQTVDSTYFSQQVAFTNTKCAAVASAGELALRVSTKPRAHLLHSLSELVLLL